MAIVTSAVNLVDQIGNVGIYATGAGWSTSAGNAVSASSAVNAEKLGGLNASAYAKLTAAQALANYNGGNGIVIAGDQMQAKTIASNLTEVPVQNGLGIQISAAQDDSAVSISVKPEIYLYHTSSAVMAQNENIAFQKTSDRYSDYNSKSGTVGTDNTTITGLNQDVLYHCNAKLLVQNTSNSPVTVGVQARNWVPADVEVEIGPGDPVYTFTYYYAKTYVYVATSATMELDWYAKGMTGITLSGINLASNIQAGVIDLSVIEVCNA
jgi:hypothetical protein